METVTQTEKMSHPCFDRHSSQTFGRIHLPVAPKCNIQCAYCNRKYDCVNESRPGVTSNVLTPWQSILFLKKYQPLKRNISVIGIAGPGDPLANAEETLETFKLVREEFPPLSLCLSTNGLNLLDNVEKLAMLGVSHLTVTINGFDADIIKELYPWVRFKKKLYRGKDAAEVLIEQQFEALDKAKNFPFKLKVNTVVVKDINDDHALELAKVLKDYRVDRMNLIPVLDSGSEGFFEVERAPEPQKFAKIKKKIRDILPTMEHCQKCRADAVGLIGKDDLDGMALMKETSQISAFDMDSKPYVAVATYEGLLVNQHLGEAKELQIFDYVDSKLKFVETRVCPPSGLGNNRWEEMLNDLSDCRAILVGGVGPKPLSVLSKGIDVIEMNGFIEDGLQHVYEGKSIDHLLPKTAFKCGDSCSGTGNGCGA